MTNPQPTPPLSSTTRLSPQRRFTGRLGVACLGTAVLAGILIFLSLSFHGLCLADMRFHSDAEDIDAAIDQVLVLKSYTIRSAQPGRLEFKLVKTTPYTTRTHFKEANPECCKIVPHNTGDRGPYTNLTQRLFGYAAKVASLTYKLNYVDDDGQPKQALVTTQYAVTNCGRAWNTTH
jgi:hypothetical protein